jgi:ABC-type branched-subunit amino acid transport system substrate-binding protein
MSKSLPVNRRRFLQATGLGLFTAAVPALIKPAFAADKLKIGVFVSDSGPAALFGPAQRAAAELGVAAVNAAGGILGREVEILFADGGASPAEAAKSGVRLLLNDKVEMIFGSHDSAVRQAVENAVKGRVPYIYTPVFEGKDCSSSVFFLGETPLQQLEGSLAKLSEVAGGKTFYLIGNDYVWPRTTNEQSKQLIGKIGGSVVGEEYYPLGAPNKFDSSVAKIKSVKPAIVLQTLVGGDNVNFNRSFADFELADNVIRLSCLLEENTLAGIGKDASKNLYSSLAYFADLDGAENQKFIAAQKAKYGEKAPQQSTISKGLYDAFVFAATAAQKGKSIAPAAFATAAEGASFSTPSGTLTIRGRYADKNIYLAKCEGTQFKVVSTFEHAWAGQTCA